MRLGTCSGGDAGSGQERPSVHLIAKATFPGMGSVPSNGYLTGPKNRACPNFGVNAMDI